MTDHPTTEAAMLTLHAGHKPWGDNDGSLIGVLEAWGLNPPDFIESLDRWGYEIRVRAAIPAQEPLDVERLTTALWGMKWDADAQRMAQKIAAEYARLRDEEEHPDD